MEGKFKRRLAAIVFTDIVGYTHLMHINEDHALRLRSRHREILQALHKKYDGEVLQFFGDGTLSIFNSSVNAVECSVEMQIEYKKDPEVPVRIGIHVGDISYDGTDAFGDGLNVAARIEPICEPGGVYISERVFEDIRNHAWLQAVHVGNYQLKNIEGQTPLYAISSKGMALPIHRNQRTPPNQYVKAYPVPPGVSKPSSSFNPNSNQEYPIGIKSKTVAGVLALTLGIFGVHRFYLGDRLWGMANFVGFFLLLFVSIAADAPIVLFLMIPAFIEAILFFVMPKKEFDFKYNGGIQPSKKEMRDSQRDERREERSRERKERRYNDPGHIRKSRGSLIIKDAFIAYKAGHYDMARKYFEDALQYDYNDPQTHFMLACCHALNKDARQAYFHLASAVDFGFQEFEEIYHNEALEWLRNLPDFEAFVQNGYRQLAYLDKPKEDLLETKSYYDATVLDRIADLGELLSGESSQKMTSKVRKRPYLGIDPIPGLTKAFKTYSVFQGRN
jgi:class 3 adenylate cyclase/TM2 domain-containing membrane protein YozV